MSKPEHKYSGPKTVGNDPAHPVPSVLGNYSGLTKREVFAMAAMQGLAASLSASQIRDLYLDRSPSGIGPMATRLADETIAALNAPKES